MHFADETAPTVTTSSTSRHALMPLSCRLHIRSHCLEPQPQSSSKALATLVQSNEKLYWQLDWHMVHTAQHMSTPLSRSLVHAEQLCPSSPFWWQRAMLESSSTRQVSSPNPSSVHFPAGAGSDAEAGSFSKADISTFSLRVSPTLMPTESTTTTTKSTTKQNANGPLILVRRGRGCSLLILSSSARVLISSILLTLSDMRDIDSFLKRVFDTISGRLPPPLAPAASALRWFKKKTLILPIIRTPALIGIFSVEHPEHALRVYLRGRD